MQVCSEPSCPNLVDRGRCNPCAIAADRRRPNATDRGYGWRWRRTRREYLAAHPICECDDPACTELAVDVHHIDGRGPSGPRGHDWSNLKAMSHACHSRETVLSGGAFARG